MASRRNTVHTLRHQMGARCRNTKEHPQVGVLRFFLVPLKLCPMGGGVKDVLWDTRWVRLRIISATTDTVVPGPCGVVTLDFPQSPQRLQPGINPGPQCSWSTPPGAPFTSIATYTVPSASSVGAVQTRKSSEDSSSRERRPVHTVTVRILISAFPLALRAPLVFLDLL